MFSALAKRFKKESVIGEPKGIELLAYISVCTTEISVTGWLG
jgi:hypothetical protein